MSAAKKAGVIYILTNPSFPDYVKIGKVLRKAHRYFKKDPVYQGNREIMPLKDEWKLKFRDFVKCILPRKLEQKLKKRMMKRGMTFYSPLDE